MKKSSKRYYDRGYVNAMDKLRVFIESRNKVMFVEHEYASSEVARNAYNEAIDRIRCRGLVRVMISKGELFVIRKDI